ncbi:MAG: ABC transporter substrate-binding protein, partial [Firmicutes bacterium]|nr:ABC transporter substrate-binding protein [Bacillota bacterium]
MTKSPRGSSFFSRHSNTHSWHSLRPEVFGIPFLLLATFLVLIALGSLPAGTVAAASSERVLRLAGDDYGFPSPYGFYPRGPGYLRMSLLFDTLVWKDQKGLVPLLASRWEEKDGGRVWTFELNPKARWHDGQAVTAADVVFTFRYFQENRHPWFDLSAVKEVRELDAHRVEISLKEPYAPFLTNLAGSLPILPKHIWEKVQDPKKFLSPAAAIGSGPFRLEKYDREQALYIYTANPDYFLGRPVIDRLILRPQAEPVLALRKGEIDGASLKVDEAALLKGDPQLQVIEGPALWVYRLYFNLQDPLLGQKEFRQAVAYAINRQEIVDRALHGGATPGVAGYIPPSSPWYSPTTDYPFNPDRARQLLDGLGLKDRDGDGYREGPKGEKISYQLLFASPYARVAELVQGYFKAVGLKVELKALDTKALDGIMEKNQYQLALNGHGGVGGDPAHLSRFTSSVGSQAPAQWSNTW